MTVKSLDSTAHQASAKPLLITSGEPAGIGMDIVLDVLHHHADVLAVPVWLCCDYDALTTRANLLNLPLPAHRIICPKPDLLATPSELLTDINEMLDDAPMHSVTILHLPSAHKVTAGVLDTANAKMVEQQLHLAHHLASSGMVSAIITAPIQKSVLIDADIRLDNGEPFSGHTEYFMHKSGCDKVVMMLANSVMKVALVTTHLPLRAVADAISADEVRQTVQITHHALVTQFGISAPKILVCGLNPHAGEAGHLGDEEIHIINPVLKDFQSTGMNISDAMPADTLFTHQHLTDCDAVIAMYHDQGLAPLKSHGFGDTVNITLGLPYIRTSVDHGTALSIAGSGSASSSSLIQAIKQALAMVSAS